MDPIYGLICKGTGCTASEGLNEVGYCSSCIGIITCKSCNYGYYTYRGQDTFGHETFNYCDRCLEKVSCKYCTDEQKKATDPSNVLMCDNCNGDGAMCLRHAGLEEIPQGNWFCSIFCEQKEKTATFHKEVTEWFSLMRKLFDKMENGIPCNESVEQLDEIIAIQKKRAVDAFEAEYPRKKLK